MHEMQHQGDGADGRLYDVFELRREQVRLRQLDLTGFWIYPENPAERLLTVISVVFVGGRRFVRVIAHLTEFHHKV